MAERSMASSLAPTFLLSMPQMTDPNFTRTVVLLCKHHHDGAFGLVVNRPLVTSGRVTVNLDPPVSTDREPANLRIERRTFRHGPRLQHPVDFQTKVVVQSRGAVFLNNEHAPGARALLLWTRFRCLIKLPLAFVFAQ